MTIRCMVLVLWVAGAGSVAKAACVEHSTFLHRLARIDTPGFATRVAARDDIVIVADQEPGFRVYDVSLPTSPVLLSSFDTWGFAIDVELSGSKLYVADWITFQSFNFTDPTNPVFLDAIGLPGKVQGMAVGAEHAYVACDSAGLQVVDLFNPATLSIGGSIALPGNATDVVVVGNHAFVATGRPGPFPDVEVIDVSDPTHPLQVASIDAGTDDDQAERLATDGSFLYVVGENLSIIDIRVPTSPVQIAISEWPTNAQDVVVEGNYVYVADFISGLQVFNVSDPFQPQLVGANDAPNSGRGVAVAGNLAFVSLLGGGLQIFDRTNPESPPAIGQVSTGFGTFAIARENDVAVVAVGEGGILTVDLSNPANPTVLGALDPGSAYNVVFENGLAYVNGSTTGSALSILKIAPNPAAPTILGQLPGNFLDGLAKMNNFVFSGSGNGIAVINVTNPLSPVLITTFPTSGTHRHLLRNGTRLYASDSVSGLLILNVSNPAAPFILGTLPGSGFAGGLALDGTTLWSSNGASGIQAVDVFDPANPTVIGEGPLPDEILKLTVHFGTAYCTSAGGAILVVDVNDPAHPTFLGEAFHLGFAKDLLVHEDHLIAAAATSLIVYPLECPTPTGAPWSIPANSRTISISPNPVSSWAQVSFHLPSAGRAQLSIFDIAGRNVRSEETMLSAGTQTWTWNACDDGGRPLASGVYFVHLSVLNQDLATQKVVVRR